MKSPYLLRKRNGIYQYKLAHEKTYHSTFEKNRTRAERFVIENLTGTAPEKPLTEIILSAFASDFFLLDTCSFIAKKTSKGKEITKEMAQMRRGHLHNHILPKFGKRIMKSITKSDIDEWLIHYQGIANRTKNHIIDTIRIIWDEAVDRGVIKENPMRSIEKFANNSKDRDIFTREEMHRLFPRCIDELRSIWGSLKYASLFTVLATTGIREGEALALTWDDWVIKGDSSVLLIKKSVKNDRRIGSTKNKKERISHVNSHTSAVLEMWRNESEYSNGDELIFPNLIGEPLQRKSCLKNFHKGLEKAQVVIGERNIVVHSLRHGFNTLYRTILGDEALQKFTGHSSKDMTSHYDHPSIDDRIALLSKYHQVFDQTWQEKVMKSGS